MIYYSPDMCCKLIIIEKLFFLNRRYWNSTLILGVYRNVKDTGCVLTDNQDSGGKVLQLIMKCRLQRTAAIRSLLLDPELIS